MSKPWFHTNKFNHTSHHLETGLTKSWARTDLKNQCVIMLHRKIWFASHIWNKVLFWTTNQFNFITRFTIHCLLNLQTDLSHNLQQLSGKAKAESEFIQRLKTQTEKINVSPISLALCLVLLVKERRRALSPSRRTKQVKPLLSQLSLWPSAMPISLFNKIFFFAFLHFCLPSFPSTFSVYIILLLLQVIQAKETNQINTRGGERLEFLLSFSSFFSAEGKAHESGGGERYLSPGGTRSRLKIEVRLVWRLPFSPSFHVRRLVVVWWYVKIKLIKVLRD